MRPDEAECWSGWRLSVDEESIRFKWFEFVRWNCSSWFVTLMLTDPVAKLRGGGGGGRAMVGVGSRWDVGCLGEGLITLPLVEWVTVPLTDWLLTLTLRSNPMPSVTAVRRWCWVDGRRVGGLLASLDNILTGGGGGVAPALADAELWVEVPDGGRGEVAVPELVPPWPWFWWLFDGSGGGC